MFHKIVPFLIGAAFGIALPPRWFHKNYNRITVDLDPFFHESYINLESAYKAGLEAADGVDRCFE